MGTGDIAIPAFERLLSSGYEIAGLVTQPDKPVGRKQLLTSPKIKVVAEAKGIPIWQPEKARNKEFLAEIETLAPDIIVVMAYGQILTQRLINIPRIAIINVHASLLPLYRGASCIQGPIADGHDATGVTIMHVVKALDAGDIILQEKTPILPNDTGGVVHDRLAKITPDSLLKALELLVNDEAPRVSQDDNQSTYAPKLMRDDGKLNFSKSAPELERLIRAYHPWPGTFMTYTDKKGKARRLKVFPPTQITEGTELEAGVLSEQDGKLYVGCGNESALELTSVQPEGSKVMSANDFLKGNPISPSP